jgi:hypothetical protein
MLKSLKKSKIIWGKTTSIESSNETEAFKKILARAKTLRNVNKYKRMFISLYFTRRQQERDRQLRRHLKAIREGGEAEEHIRNGRVVKGKRGGVEGVLFQIPGY